MTTTTRNSSWRLANLLVLAALLLIPRFSVTTMAQGNQGRIYVVSHVDVIPKFAVEAAKALSVYGEASRKTQVRCASMYWWKRAPITSRSWNCGNPARRMKRT